MNTLEITFGEYQSSKKVFQEHIKHLRETVSVACVTESLIRLTEIQDEFFKGMLFISSDNETAFIEALKKHHESPHFEPYFTLTINDREITEDDEDLAPPKYKFLFE